MLKSRTLARGAAVAAILLAAPATGWAQAPAAPAAAQPAPPPAPQAGSIKTTACGNALAAPAAMPPAGSQPFLWILEPCFQKQGGFSTVENETYMYYIK